MRSYDDYNFSPPAPVVLASLSNPNTGKTATDVPMLLDSGADVTVLPASVVAQLGATPVSMVETRVFDGTTFMSPVVHVDLRLGKSRFPGRYITSDADVGFIGRDILNSVILELNGPALFWSMRKR